MFSSEDAVKSASLTTFKSSLRIGAVAEPENIDDIKRIFAFAASNNRRIHAVSTGKNWGYNSALPAEDKAILVRLSRMNAIVDYDGVSGSVVIEPGVTQKQLADFLFEQGDAFWMDPAGAGLDVSIIGNTLERGFGHTAYADHFANIAWLEVVLPTGEIIRTGMAAYEGAKAANSYRWGLGPVLDGLFSQANVGIVIKMALWLMPKPECTTAFLFSSSKPNALYELIEALRPLRLDGTLQNAVHIANDFKAFQAISRYPWHISKTAPLDDITRSIQRSHLGIDFWGGTGAVYGTKAQVRVSLKRVKKALKPIADRITFIDDKKLFLAFKLLPFMQMIGLGRTATLLKKLIPVFGLLKGQPTNAILESVYWRKPTDYVGTYNPDQDGCGLMWIAPVAPLKGACAVEMAQIVEPIFKRYGFEPAMSMTMVTARALDNVICLSYDRDIAGEDEKALKCHDETINALAEKGYIPYRIGLAAGGFSSRRTDDFVAVWNRIKLALDPQEVMTKARPDA